MLTLGEFVFQIDRLETYKYTFQNNHKDWIIEYIHCIVKERLEEYDGFKPRKIRVYQIHNLEQYFFNPNYNDFSERILNTDKLELII